MTEDVPLPVVTEPILVEDSTLLGFPGGTYPDSLRSSFLCLHSLCQWKKTSKRNFLCLFRPLYREVGFIKIPPLEFRPIRIPRERTGSSHRYRPHSMTPSTPPYPRLREGILHVVDSGRRASQTVPEDPRVVDLNSKGSLYSGLLCGGLTRTSRSTKDS